MKTREELLQWYEDLGRPVKSELRKQKDFLKDLKERYSFMGGIKRATNKHYVYCLLNDIDEPPKCLYCGSSVSDVSDHRFRDYCSTKCGALDSTDKKRETCLKKYGATHHLKTKECLDKQRKTNLERYGSEFLHRNEEIKVKAHKTIKEKYGSECYFHTDDYKEKLRTTSIEKYGHEHFSSSQEVKNKRVETSLKNFGTHHPMMVEEVKEKVKETNIERFGVPYYSMTDEYKEKVKETNLERYGFPSVFQNEHIREKVKATNVERYGFESPMKNEHIKEKVKETNIEKYGVSRVFVLEDFKEKVKESNLEKYGVPYYSMTDEYKEKVKETNLERYGVPYYSMTDECKEKMRETSIERYGVSNFNQKHIPEPILSLFNDQELLSNHYDCFDTILEAAFDIGAVPSTYGTHLKRHGIEIKIPNKKFTKGHKEIVEIVKKHYSGEVIINHRISGVGEIDVFIPDLMVGFEFNGHYWHSDIFKEKSYHQKKSLACIENGIKLLHVWEYDWKLPSKRKILEEKIKMFIGASDKKVYARKTEVVHLSAKEASEFYEKTHIQGGKKCGLNFSLSYMGEIVACISLKKEKNKDNSYHIERYATSCQVTGGFSKLLSYAKKQIDGWEVIKTFASLDYGRGSMYEMCGFEYDGTSSPNYKYIKGDTILSREQCMKHKLVDLLEAFDPDLTEKENMNAHGFLRVYDAGSIKYVMKKENPLD